MLAQINLTSPFSLKSNESILSLKGISYFRIQMKKWGGKKKAFYYGHSELGINLSLSENIFFYFFKQNVISKDMLYFSLEMFWNWAEKNRMWAHDLKIKQQKSL